jgi:hypothetical protein
MNDAAKVEPTPVGPDSDVCQVLTSLREKFVVDFANGIDVVRDHVRVQKKRQGFFNRLTDGFTGEGVRRQAEINASLAEGVEASLNWLCELSQELALSNLAIVHVNDRVTALTTNVAVLAGYSTETRQQLRQLAQRLESDIQGIQQEVRRIDFIQKVRMNLDTVFDRWDAGRFGELSLAGRCYAALEELRWGAFGDYCRLHHGRQRDDFMESAINRIVARLSDDADAQGEARLDTRRVWLAPVRGRPGVGDMAQALAYLADGFSPDTAPFVTSIAGNPLELPLEVPLVSSASRIAAAVAGEVFPECSHV